MFVSSFPPPPPVVWPGCSIILISVVATFIMSLSQTLKVSKSVIYMICFSCVKYM